MSNKSSLLKGLNSLWGVIINHAHSSTPTHTQPKKGHNHPHPAKKGHTHSCPLTPSQKKITPNQKRSHSSTPTHTQPKKSDAHPHLPTCSQKKVILTYTSCKSMEKKIIHKLIKFIRNSRSLKYNFAKYNVRQLAFQFQHSIGQMTNKSAAVINNFR